MRVDRNQQLIRVGSLVLWDREHSADYQCMGVVVRHEFEKLDNGKIHSCFLVLWSDNDRCQYDYGELWRGHVKVVKF